MTTAEDTDRWVVVGQINGFYGVRGWVKVFSQTAPREGIAAYKPLYLKRDGSWHPIVIAEGRLQGKGVVLKFEGIDDRDAAAALMGAELAVKRSQLPPTAADEYYWTDLVGLAVVNQDGVDLGTIDHLFETGANDVIVVRGDRERLIPFVQGSVIKRVDLAARRMDVDWDADD